jgi:peptidyl-dipeptidase A
MNGNDRVMLPLALTLALSLFACATPPPPECPSLTAAAAQPGAEPPSPAPQGAAAPAKTDEACTGKVLGAPAAEAREFLRPVEADLLKLWVAREHAGWVKSTFITDDTELLSAAADEAVMEATARYSALAICRFGAYLKELPADLRRKIDLLRLSISLPAPKDAARRTELARIGSLLEGMYGKGKYCPPRLKGACLNLEELSELLAKKRDYDQLLDAWQGWHSISPPMREQYARLVEYGNEGARELGFKDLGELWRSRYDMSAQDFEAELGRLWSQVKPLYEDLHCYARGKLQQKYGKDKVPSEGPIPAHLFGNMWSQSWENLFDLLAPAAGKKAAGLDVDKALVAKKVDAKGMVRYGEGFFSSLGFAKLPKTFWERSLFVMPKDREVVCHASAWDVDWVEDIRIKMCIKVGEEDFTTIHHELGHNYYQRAYKGLDPLFRDSANDGFHEALGDTIALSVTPSYLKTIGLLKEAKADDTSALLKRALEKVAFLPFGLLIDKWRWDVFAGKTKPAEYNRHWWELREKLQGVKAPVARTEKDFDPGAKYHIPANVPYTRYFLAALLQFQFHRALCKLSGHKGPLHTCSIYGNKEAGRRIEAMMAMGQSKPWPEALKAVTGEERMDASAMLEYFKPLQEWLKEQNKGKVCKF